MGTISYTCYCAGDVLTKPSNRTSHGGYARVPYAGESSGNIKRPVGPRYVTGNQSYPIAGASSRSKPNARDLVYMKVLDLNIHILIILCHTCFMYTLLYTAFMPLGTSCWIHPSYKSCSCTCKSCSSHLCVWSAEVLFPINFLLIWYWWDLCQIFKLSGVFPWFCRSAPSTIHHIDGLPYARGTILKIVYYMYMCIF